MYEKTPLLPVEGGEVTPRCRPRAVIAMIAAVSLLAISLFNSVGDLGANIEVHAPSEGWGWGSVSGACQDMELMY